MSAKKVNFTRKDGKKVGFRSNGTRKLVKKAERNIDAAHANQVIVAPEDSAKALPAGDPEQSQQFPTAFLSAAEEKDLMMQTRMAIGNKLGEQQFKTEDANWLLRKMQAAKDADFQAWFAKNFDKSSVTAKAWGRDVFPEFYSQRMKTLDINLDTLRKLARIKIRGLESPEDVALQYAADRGLLPLDQLKNLLNPSQIGEATQLARFQRGMFNTNTYFDHVAPNPNNVNQNADNRATYYGTDDPATTGRWSYDSGSKSSQIARGFLN